ncbi:hypothetical protein CXM95_06665 [Enterococcus sp. CR-Ec1]|nr:hypothetical protein CXM95_06665 [Enterococcus sp. CR-Ec1]
MIQRNTSQLSFSSPIRLSMNHPSSDFLIACDSIFNLERDGKNIIFTPTEEMNDEDGGFVLKPR